MVRPHPPLSPPSAANSSARKRQKSIITFDSTSERGTRTRIHDRSRSEDWPLTRGGVPFCPVWRMLDLIRHVHVCSGAVEKSPGQEDLNAYNDGRGASAACGP